MTAGRSVALAFAAGLLGCAAAPEQNVLRQFFRALTQDDRTAVSGVSMASFPGGPVMSWELVETGPETRGPYRIPELREEETAGKKRRDDQFKTFYDFRQANREELEAVADRRQQNPDAAIRGGLGTIAAAWDEHRAERRRVVSALSEVQMALDEERRRTRRSLLREAPVDYLTGGVAEKELRVRTVEESGAREYRFSLIRYELRNQFDSEVPSRWIIAAIEPLPAPR